MITKSNGQLRILKVCNNEFEMKCLLLRGMATPIVNLLKIPMPMLFVLCAHTSLINGSLHLLNGFISVPSKIVFGLL